MIRRGRLPATGSGARPFATTSLWLQVQHRDRIINSTHGAGFTKHMSMAKIAEGSNVPRSVTQAAPAADLFRTKVHEGLGTSAEDPYLRTLPNQQSIPPESTVLASAAVTAPTADEVATIGKKWGSMQYWIGDQFPRLPVFLKSLIVADAMPVSATAEQLTGQFESQIPTFLKDRPAADHDAMTALWKKAIEDYGNVSAKYIFDRAAFENGLSSLHAKNIAAAKVLSPGGNEASMALEVLRRKAVLKRNQFIDQSLIPIATNCSYLAFGDGVWRIFFDAVSRKKADIFGKDDNRMVGFAWDALMLEDNVKTPSVTAVTALYLTLLSIGESHLLLDAAGLEASHRIDDGIGNSHVTRSLEHTLRLVNPTNKRRFVMEEVRALLEDSAGSKALSVALRSSGMHDHGREAALCEAMNNAQQLMEAEADSLAGRFSSTSEVKSLLASIMAGTDEAARRHVAEVLHVPLNGQVDWDATFLSLGWETNWRQLSTTLLADSATLACISTLVANAIGSKGAMKHLYSREYADELSQVLRARDERVQAKKAKVEHLVSDLSSHRQVDQTIGLLSGLGVSLAALHEEAAATEDKLRTPRMSVDPKVLSAVEDAIALRHPSWVKAGVIASSSSSSSSASQKTPLELMVRIFVRLAYVPQAGAAKIAQHTRRRIGQIGLEPHQFNIAAEMGHVEQYDNLQYKRYDWQGWYQRMVDVHNRNVSIRCRLDDLKRIDGCGNPFVDLQTERRLRIIADNRVGMGVLKLDSDKYEDQSDNMTFGSNKLSEILAESRKAQLGAEYWPSVEVKIRKPSGQSQAHYSVIDDERIEKRSKELYEKYRDAKKRSLFVTPMDLWLEVKGMQVRKTAETADAHGYTVDSLQDSMGVDGE